MTYATAPFERATHADTGAGEPGPMLVWQFAEPLRAVSSGMIGGGIADISWVLNAHVMVVMPPPIMPLDTARSGSPNCHTSIGPGSPAPVSACVACSKCAAA
jgi:hypothetical protein